MIRRGLTALVITAVALGLVAAHGIVLARADNGPQITNLSVTTNGTTATFIVCAETANPPLRGGVAISGPNGPSYQNVSANGGCGGVSGAGADAITGSVASGTGRSGISSILRCSCFGVTAASDRKRRFNSASRSG